MDRFKGNKYVWRKDVHAHNSNYGQTAVPSTSNYKFIRPPAVSNGTSTANSISPPLRNTVGPMNHNAKSGTRGRVRVFNMIHTGAKPATTFKFTKVPDLNAKRQTFNSRWQTKRNLAKHTVYKYIANGRHDVGITQKGRIESGFSSKVNSQPKGHFLTVIANWNRYRRTNIYKKSFGNDTVTNVPAITRAKVTNGLGSRNGSRIQNIGSKSQRKSLRFQRAPVCSSYMMTGMCEAGSDCSSVHDDNYIRICPRYLHHRCPLGRFLCPLAHVLDPCRLPICEFYETSGCNRVNCPYLHSSGSPDTPICPNFQKGRCPRGRTCSKRHIWLTKKTRKTNVSKDRNISTLSPTSSQVMTPAPLDHPDTLLSETQVPLFISLLPSPTPVPEGSLRNVFPPPDFIPLLNNEDLNG